MSTPVQPLAIEVIVAAGNSIGTLQTVRAEVASVGASAEVTAAQTVAAADKIIASYTAAAAAAQRVGAAAAAAGATSTVGLAGVAGAASKAGGALRSLAGGFVAALAIGGGIELIHKAVEAAGDEAKSVRTVGYAFGDAKQEVLEFGEKAATTMGMASAKANMMAAELGNFFSAQGIVGKQAAEMTTALVAREVDIAKATGKSRDEVQSALISAMRGRGLAAQTIGVKISPQILQGEAYREGLIPDADTDLTPKIKAQAAWNVIMADSDKKQGAYAATMHTSGTEAEVLSASMEDFAAKLGTAVRPALAAVGGVLVSTVVPTLHAVSAAVSGVLDWFGRWPAGVLKVIGVLGTLLLLRGPLTSMFLAVAQRIVGVVFSLAGYATASGRAEINAKKLAAAQFLEGQEALKAAEKNAMAAAGAEALAAAEMAAARAAGVMGESVAVAGVTAKTTMASIEAFAGPIGWIALIAGTVVSALGLLGGKEKETTKTTNDLAGAFDNLTGKMTATANATIADAFAEQAGAYVKMGGHVGDYTQAIEGVPGKQEEVTKRLKASAVELVAGSGMWEELSKSPLAAGMTIQSLINTLVNGTDAEKAKQAIMFGAGGGPGAVAYKAIVDMVSGQSGLQSDMVAGAKTFADGLDHAKKAAAETGGAAEKGADQVGELVKQFQSLPDEVAAATAALDKFAGRSRTLEQARADYSAGLQDALDAFNVGQTKTENGVTTSVQTKIDPSLVLRSGEIDTSNRDTGGKLRDMVLKRRDELVADAQAASDTVLSNHGTLAQAAAAARAQAVEGLPPLISVLSQILHSRTAALRLVAGYGLSADRIVAGVQVNRDADQKRLDAARNPGGADAGAGEPGGFARGGSVWGGVQGVDSVHILAQHGEFVSNVAAANAHRSELQAWNAQGYARGGTVTEAGPHRGGTVTIAPGGIQISIDASGASPAEVALYASQAFRRSLEQAILDDVDRSL